MAAGYLIVGMFCGACAGGVSLWLEGNLLSAVLIYAAVGNVGLMSAAGLRLLRPLPAARDA